MSDINQAIIQGKVAKKPEQRSTPKGSSVTEFRVESREAWRDREKGEDRVFATYVPVVAWGKLAQECAELQEGDQVLVQGKIKARSFEKNGEKRSVLEVNALNVQVMGGEKQREKGEEQEDEKAEGDDIPW